MANATVSRVVRNPKNKDGAIVTLSNGQVLWLQLSYITKVLEGAFMDDCRPTALVGTEVSYEMKSYAVGDLVFDKNGVVKDGETVKFTTEGSRPIKIQIGDVAGHITEFDKAKMNANAIASLYKSVGAAFGVKKAAVTTKEEVPAGDGGEETI